MKILERIYITPFFIVSEEDGLVISMVSES